MNAIPYIAEANVYLSSAIVNIINHLCAEESGVFGMCKDFYFLRPENTSAILIAVYSSILLVLFVLLLAVRARRAAIKKKRLYEGKKQSILNILAENPTRGRLASKALELGLTEEDMLDFFNAFRRDTCLMGGEPAAIAIQEYQDVIKYYRLNGKARHLMLSLYDLCSKNNLSKTQSSIVTPLLDEIIELQKVATSNKSFEIKSSLGAKLLCLGGVGYLLAIAVTYFLLFVL